LAEPDAYLLVALSGRALAMAAKRAGRRARVLDLFGDTDTRAHSEASAVVAGSLEHGFDADALIEAAERLAPSGAPEYGLVYGSGLEDRPAALAKLCRGRRLYGNRPEVVAVTKDPRAFFPVLEDLGVPYPSVSFAPPMEPENWLVKRIGGSGGSHVGPAITAAHDGGDHYYQLRLSGRPIGVSFLADGKRAFLLGISEQWAWPQRGEASFRFGGALQPAPVAASVLAEIPALLDAIVREIGLVGLNSLDLIVDGERFAVIEVNPRPGANLDIFDGSDPAGLFGLHLRACAGELPTRWQPPTQATAMAVVYADQASLVPVDIRWPDWVADRPAPGARIEAGAPVSTVLAAAPSVDTLRPLVEERVASVLTWLEVEDRSRKRRSAVATG
jgi:predicted ATP-grasp superfamily ATP-dependent carboligase